MLQNHAVTVRIYPNVAKAYAANGNMALAYSYSNLAYIANEAWQKERNAIILSGVQHKVDMEKHRAVIQKSEDEVSHQKFLLYSVAIGLLIVLIALGMFLSQQGKLKNTYTKLIQSEKMAVLGQLSASIAHEVNTPLGAIKSSSEESIEAFPEILTELSWLMHTLNKEDKKAFMEFLVTSNPAGQTLSTKEEREIKKKIRDTFTELGVENNRYLADRLVQVGIYDIQPELATIAGHPHFGKLMQLTYNILNQQRSNQTIHLAVEKASRIVKALKTYIHTSNSDEMDTINVRDNIETVLTIYHNRLKQGIQVVKNYDDVQNIVGYPDKLNQVWTNLIVNAVQAMDNNGILNIGIQQQADYVVVSIKDSGKGIPIAIQSKIFDPFFTTKSKGEGSGLGLDIIKRIVEEHNATISFQSIEGEGTTFYVKIPVNKM
ncbi:MAG: GHKL domain-containing protein [Ignavibacteria bacterium]|nr:GHKL domain-containing protein [Ignavibacteria bacterium]